MSTLNTLEKKRRLFTILRCPHCKGVLDFSSGDTYMGMPLHSTIWCRSCGDVGIVENLRPFFNVAPSVSKRSSIGRDFSGRLASTPVAIKALGRVPDEAWHECDGRVYSETPGGVIRIHTLAIAVELMFLMHPWSGIAELTVDGSRRQRINLFESTGSRLSNHPLYLGKGPHNIEIVCTGESSEGSKGAQVWLCGVDAYELDEGGVGEFEKPAFNAGNPYPRAFEVLVKNMPPQASILDCGCGDRNHPDPRVLGFEYGSFKGPDVFGDGHKLPFANNSFDLLLSQAVIEHLYDPRVACAEMYRVLKPGGTIYVESAFMQPLHAVPYHFFNTTAWGLEELLKPFEILETRHEGTLYQTLKWIYSLTALRDNGHGEEVDSVLSAVQKLDNYITRDELKSFSSFVAITGRKPLV